MRRHDNVVDGQERMGCARGKTLPDIGSATKQVAAFHLCREVALVHQGQRTPVVTARY